MNLPGEHDVARRQLWNFPSPTSTMRPHCTPFELPSGGIIELGGDSAVTLTTDVIFQPQCTGDLSGDVFSTGHLKSEFYASTTPMVYVIAAATVIAWVLVVMLTITPRTSFFGLPSTAPTFSNGHGIIGGANGGVPGLSGAGSRPWLQKVAALAVAISLTIATADTLEVAQQQYSNGFADADLLRRQVFGSLEIRIVRVISDIFLWLAQVQTLIRLFPRHKEKVMIKWIGFLLIILDTVFACLNAFWINSEAKGRHFVDAIPALSYLFELALGLLYAAWVIYYSLTKRRYAYYHPKMRSISLIALLSLVAILTPVVFFVTDVSNQDVAGWGDYFRWVGAAAASVVVWEWVERIEALERDDKKDGILGREIFDGDEMLDVMPSEETPWSQSRNLRRNFRRPGRGDDQEGGHLTEKLESGIAGITGVANRLRQRHQQSPQHFPLGRARSGSEPNSSENARKTENDVNNTISTRQPDDLTILGGPTPPAPVLSPVNRADTTSAASTMYVVRYHPVADVPQPIRRRVTARAQQQQRQQQDPSERGVSQTLAEHDEKDLDQADDDDEVAEPNRNREASIWHTVSNPFKRKRTSPPQEIQRARAAADNGQRATTPAHNFSRWDVKNRLGVFAAEAGHRFRDQAASRRQAQDLPVTVIPAQPRGSGMTWSPVQDRGTGTDTAANVDDEEKTAEGTESEGTTSTTVSMEGRHIDFAATPRKGRTSPVRSSRISGAATTLTHVGVDPPRADDISPANGRSAGTTVIPAPPRRQTSFQETSVVRSPGSATSPRSAAPTDASRTMSPDG